jgi:hypothetical protein
MVVRRRMRVGRRRPGLGPLARIGITAGLVLAVGAGVAAFVWSGRPTGLAAVPSPAVVAPGGFRASIDAQNTLTVGLEVRNVTEQPLTLTGARIVPPAGLTLVTVTIVAPGEKNEGFALEDDLPPLAPVELGITATDRNAIVAARFTIDCDALPTADAAVGEEIFVTIAVAGQSRVEELTPPVLDDLPWLIGSAQRSCLDPVPSESPEPPLPPLPS